MKGVYDNLLQRENDQENDDKLYLTVSHKKNEIEQYIYATREKFDHELKPHTTAQEKETLNKIMDPILDWLYSDDENIYNKKTLDEKSKDMFELGNKIYSRFNNWTKLNENIVSLEKALIKSQEIIKEEVEKLAKKTTILIQSDIDNVTKATEAANKSLIDFKAKEAAGDKLKEPELKPDAVSTVTSGLNAAFEAAYKEAQKRKDEEERKRKEEERKKKEEEDKKKKEEEEKKKKEEEEKKKKEEKKEDKKEEKKDEDVVMKDETQKKEESKKDSNAMDVE